MHPTATARRPWVPPTPCRPHHRDTEIGAYYGLSMPRWRGRVTVETDHPEEARAIAHALADLGERAQWSMRCVETDASDATIRATAAALRISGERATRSLIQIFVNLDGGAREVAS